MSDALTEVRNGLLAGKQPRHRDYKSEDGFKPSHARKACFRGQSFGGSRKPNWLKSRERHSLGTRRRIEITAFRRATIVFRPQAGNVFGSGPPVETERSGPVGFDSAQAGEVYPAEAQVTTVADSSALKLIIDALVKNDGDVASAAKQVGLSRNDFISKLCGLGFSIK